jgi:hypothetical protein
MDVTWVFKRTKAGDTVLRERSVPLTMAQKFFLNFLNGKRSLAEIQAMDSRNFANAEKMVQELSLLGFVELVTTGQSDTKTRDSKVFGTNDLSGIRNPSQVQNPSQAKNPSEVRNPSQIRNSSEVRNPSQVKNPTLNGATRSTLGGSTLYEDPVQKLKNDLSDLVQQYYGPMARHHLEKIRGCASPDDLRRVFEESYLTMIEAFSKSKADSFLREGSRLFEFQG